MMPNKTIYVSDSDLPIFEKAQQLAGDNLSSTIVQALKRFVDAHESGSGKYKEISVKVGKRVRSYKRFLGRFLAKGHFGEGNDTQQEYFEVYQTAKGNIALYVRKMPGWWFTGRPPKNKNWKHMDWENWGDWDSAWSKTAEGEHTGSPWWAEKGEYDLEVFENIEALKARIPEELYAAAESALQGERGEWLDI